MKEKILSLIKTSKQDNISKKIENLVIFVIILVITIIIINNMWSNGTDKQSDEFQNIINNKQLSQKENQNNSLNVDDMEYRLEEILKTINGVGETKVFISYQESSSVQAMYNENTKQSETEENSISGEKKTIQETNIEKEVIYSETNGNKVPVTQKVINPKIEGVIVTAQGANNTNIKANIVEAISAVTGLGVHKIQVFEMSK